MRTVAYLFVALLVVFIILFAVFGGYNRLAYESPRFISQHKPVYLNNENTVKPANSQWVTVLAIDGGGVRGIIPLYALAYLEKKTGKPISQLFNMIAGTSTGSIIAASLTVPNSQGHARYSAEDVLSFYNRYVGDLLKPGALHHALTVGGLLGPRISAKRLDDEFKILLGPKIPMTHLLTNVFINAYSLGTSSPIIFTSWGPNSDFYVNQVVSGATATPGLFAPVNIYSINHKVVYTLVDAVTYANSPATTALLKAHELFPNKKILLVSLGTGKMTMDDSKAYQQVKSWGFLQWTVGARDLMLLLNADTSFQVEQLKNLLKASKQHNVVNVRVNIAIPRANANPFDIDADNVKQLNRLGKKLVQQSKGQLDKVAKLLMAH